MTKKEQEIQTRLMDLLDANIRVLEEVCKLLVQAANPIHHMAPITPLPIEDIQKVAEEAQAATPPPAAQQSEVDAEITPEYCRKALKAITKKTSTAEAKEFLATFGGAKTIPQLEKKYYEGFIAKATDIMNGPDRKEAN